MTDSETPTQPHPLQKLRELFVSGTLATLPGTQALVLIGFATHADRKGEAYPSCNTIAKGIGKNTKTVERARAALVKSGHLAHTNRKARGACRSPKVYRVTAFASNQAPPDAPEAKGTPKCPLGTTTKGTPDIPSEETPRGQIGEPRGQNDAAKGTFPRVQGDAQVSPEGIKGLKVRSSSPAPPAGSDSASPMTGSKAAARAALLAVFPLEDVTPKDKKRNAALARDLALRLPADVDAGGAEDLLRQVKAKYHAMFPTAQCTPRALDKHWGALTQSGRSAAGVSGLDALTPAESEELYARVVADDPGLVGHGRGTDRVRRAMYRLKQAQDHPPATCP